MDKPLIYQITNSVSAQLQADCVALLGGVSIMSRQRSEAREIAARCDALLINIGTPPDCAAELYEEAACAAIANSKPVIADLVGYGFTRYRTEAADRFLSRCKCSVIKGNASEIKALCWKNTAPRGVSDTGGLGRAGEAAMESAKRFGCVVYCTGERDFLSDGKSTVAVDGGSALLAQTSGIGCALGSATALFCALMPPYEASMHALKLFRRAAEAAGTADGPYSFRAAFMDMLAKLGGTGGGENWGER